MQIPKSIAKVARWLAVEHGFWQLSAEAKRAAWIAVGSTHALILLIAFGFTCAAPALHPTLRDIVIVHFLVALLIASVLESTSRVRQLLGLAPWSFESSGWFFAFKVTLMPLLVFAFVLWALG